MKEYALIVAGGKGTRFGSATPKQFLLLNNKPVLLHTLEAFHRYSVAITIIVVLPEEDIPTWKALTQKYPTTPSHSAVAGGVTRFDSVRNGLEKIPDDALVAIHDGVRPLVNTGIIADSFATARVHRTAVAAVTLKESLRLVHHDQGAGSRAVDRSAYRIVQTPQTFYASLIKNAYKTADDSTFTDDASVAERAGHAIHLYPGSYDNIKITTPEDLIVAEALCRRSS